MAHVESSRLLRENDCQWDLKDAILFLGIKEIEKPLVMAAHCL